jgi:hypothetical protein
MIDLMSHSTAVVLALAITASLVVGWYGAKAKIAHGDLNGTIRKISGLRRARTNNGGVALVVVVIALFILYKVVVR